MQLKDEKTWTELKRMNAGTPLGGTAIAFTERWANLMEKRLVNGEKLSEMFRETCREADLEHITGHQYSFTVNILTEVWIHGKELRVLHTDRFGEYHGK